MRDERNEPDVLQRRIARLLSPGADRAFGGIGLIRLGTDVGAIRQRNEDRAIVATASYHGRPDRDCIVAVVCDGMGGLADGDQAAVLAASTFVTRTLRGVQKSAQARLVEAVLNANQAVHARWKGRAGSTLSAILIEQEKAYGINIGDSRIYGIFDESEVKQLSTDDTLGALLQRPDNDVNRNQLLQFVGMGDDAEPHFYNFNDPSGRRFKSFLLTTDGVHGPNPDAFRSIVRNATSAAQLIERLLAMSRFLGGRDNGSAVLVPKEAIQPEGEIENGLSLNFSTASKNLEVWSPSVRKDASVEILSDARTEPSIGQEVQKPKRPAKPKRPRKGARKGDLPIGKKGVGDQRLPLGDERPELDVKFPRQKHEP